MDDARRCHANSKQSHARCKRAAIRGGSVCSFHGGKSPVAIIAAADRLNALVHPAISGLAELIANADSDSVRLSAIRDLLDRTGYKPREKVETTGETTIRVQYADNPVPPVPSTNGHA